jgi:hypothetical protein
VHCSVIGTCLSTGELRQILGRLGMAPPHATDHELHGRAVALAGRHTPAAKLLNKALDQRHRLAINRYARAHAEPDVRALWQEDCERGDIPGAYWATLTHPATTHALIHDAFDHVHMLSHLVGAANRADIRRLQELQEQKSALEDKLLRQQAHLRDAIVSRDATINELRQALTHSIAAAATSRPAPVAETTLAKLVTELERKLASEQQRRARAEERLAAAQAEAVAALSLVRAAEYREAALRDELETIEHGFVMPSASAVVDGTQRSLDGLTLLYVGGRPNQIAHLRDAANHLGAVLTYHDGGVEENTGILAGLTSRADLVMFPVDCVSHEAAGLIKRTCRNLGKRYVPLRTSGVTSFLAAISRADGAAPFKISEGGKHATR